MKVTTLAIPAQETRPATKILHVGDNFRVVSFTVDANQSIRSHVNDGSVTLYVMEGTGLFTGRDGQSAELRAGQMVTYEPCEPHGIASLNGLLRFVAFISHT